MSEANKAVVRRWFEEVWNQGREATIDELFAAGALAHGLGDSEADVHGPAEFKQFVSHIRGSIPNLSFTVEDLVAEGDRVAVRITLKGVHSGPGLGVEPSGGDVSIQGIVIVRIVNGQIVEGWNSYDQLGLLRQVGALPGRERNDSFLSANG
jgi:predicted ester cyclase